MIIKICIECYEIFQYKFFSSIIHKESFPKVESPMNPFIVVYKSA